MSYKDYQAEITLCYENEYEKLLLNIIEKSLKAEAINPINNTRAKIELTKIEKCLKIHEEADSLSHIRAITNSYLYLIYTIQKTIYTVNNIKQH
uniref:KEOPS complex Pcc1-like subunit n=1 Tax=Ignisphaera aggregans TaxID=334771 RepID=A0A7J3QD73_9CREN